MVLKKPEKASNQCEEIKKEKYEPLECEIIRFGSKDIIMTSGFGLSNMGILGEIGEEGDGNGEIFQG